MDAKTKTELDRLLGGDQISGPEADAIFERALADVDRADGRGVARPVYAVVAASALAAAAAIALLLIRPADERDGLRARGGQALGAQLQVVCSGGTLAACPLSSKLIFVASDAHGELFLSGYAEPIDAAATERVWYFSRETGSPQLAAAVEGTRVFEQAVRVSGTHPPGRYRVHAYLTDRPLERDELLTSRDRGPFRASVHAELVVVED